ncbi:MAG: FAD-dependent oxidoreductase [Chloroflexi bacterium]|nr:FAD-dependent oxidoreductase [Chloroflexota bacterium]
MIGSSHQPHVWPLLRNKGVVFSVFTSLKKISGNVVTLADVHTQEERTVEVDTVVMSTGYRANDSLWRTLTGQVPELYAAGDCYSPRRALDAIHEGYNTAFKI